MRSARGRSTRSPPDAAESLSPTSTSIARATRRPEFFGSSSRPLDAVDDVGEAEDGPQADEGLLRLRPRHLDQAVVAVGLPLLKQPPPSVRILVKDLPLASGEADEGGALAELHHEAAAGRHHPLPAELAAAGFARRLVPGPHNPFRGGVDEPGPVLVLRQVAVRDRVDGEQVPYGAVEQQLLGPGEGRVAGRDRPAAERHPGPGAGGDHGVALLEPLRHRLLGDDPAGAVLDRGQGQLRPHLGVRRDGDDLRPFAAQHLDRVGVEGLDAVALAERGQPPRVALGRGHQVDLRAVVEGLRVARRPALGICEHGVVMEAGRWTSRSGVGRSMSSTCQTPMRSARS